MRAGRPALGEHTQALLREQSYLDDEIDALYKAGVVTGADSNAALVQHSSGSGA